MTLPETRWLSVRVSDKGGLTSRVASLPIKAEPGPPSGRLVVVAVGLNDFSDPRLPDLGFAVSDAARFAAAAETVGLARYSSVEVEVVPPDYDLRNDLPARLRSLAADLGPDDTLLLFFASHGVEVGDRFYLAQEDTSVDDLASTALDMASLATALSGVTARTLIFIDACHAGGVGTNDAAFAALSGEGMAFAVIAASKGRQQSLEGLSLGGGAFTSALIAAMSDDTLDTNGNGTLELVEIYAFVKRDVVAATGGRQTPWIAKSGFVGEVPLF